jgi:hypothetical protein
VGWIFGTIAATLGLLFLWGLVAPRSQWLTLTAWSVSDPHAHEPGAAGYSVRRLASAVGLIGLTSVAFVAAASFIDRLPRPPVPQTPVHAMWGEPDPHLVNRVVRGAAKPPSGLIAVSVIDYQTFEAGDPPAYLTRLNKYTVLGSTAVPGLIGVDPDTEASATDTAELVVHVRGPILCIPRSAVVVETDTTIKIGLYYGLPNSADGSPVDSTKGCQKDSSVTASLLIPIDLASPVGDRTVESLDGTELPAVRLITAQR